MTATEELGRRGKTLFWLDLFSGGTEIVGGIGLLMGFWNAPVSLLDGSPFSDFTVPGLCLTALGLGTITAMLLLLYRPPLGVLGSIAAGIFLVIYEMCEVLTFGLNPATGFYLIIGVVMAVLGLTEWRQSRWARIATRHAA